MIKNIQGKYFCYSFIPHSSYTLTGNNRVASFGVTGTIENNNMNIKCLSAPNPDNGVVFLANTIVKINRVRFRMNGAPGIQAGLNHIAAKISVEFGKSSGGIWTSEAKAFIQAPNFGEWCECGAELNAGFKQITYRNMHVNPNETIFYVDDYNIQTEYVNQGITPIIEMEIETGGISVSNDGEIF